MVTCYLRFLKYIRVLEEDGLVYAFFGQIDV